MKKTVKIPLLYWELSNGFFVGLLVTHGVLKLGRSLKSLIRYFKEYIKREESDIFDFRFYDYIEANIRVVKVRYRPRFKSEQGIFPAPYVLDIPISVIYLKLLEDFYKCFLPILGKEFYFYNIKQLVPLVENSAKTILERLSYQEVHSLLNIPRPELEEITLKLDSKETLVSKLFSSLNMQREHQRHLIEELPSKAKIRDPQFLQRAWERGSYIEETVKKLFERVNFLLVGEEGVGKTAILEEAIRTASTLRDQENLVRKLTFWKIRARGFLGGAVYLGEWQQNCEELVEAISLKNGVLWVEDFIQLVQLGGKSPQNSVAAYLLPFLESGKLTLIGELTPSQLEVLRNLLPQFASLFQILKVEEMSKDEMNKLLEYYQEHIQKSWHITIERKALERTLVLLEKFIKYEKFPGKAFKLLGHCVKDTHLKNKKNISDSEVIETFSRITGLPEIFLKDELLLDKKELEDYFKSRIIGQNDALQKIFSVIKTFKAGLNDQQKPIATMIFAGPTGVGKTASVKALAEYFFGKGTRKNPLIRLDMSEFQHPVQIQRLIGGVEGPGKFLQEVRENPFSVVLLDEIEKADPSFFDVLLSVLDEGRLIDRYGRVTDFRNTVIIMTTNLGSKPGSSIGFQREGEEDYSSAIHAFFRPEFYNRIDHVVIFNSLDRETIHKIALKELNELKFREGLRKRNIDLVFSKRLLSMIEERGFDKELGARPLQRAIEANVVAPLARFLTKHNKLSNCMLSMDWDGKKVKIKKLKKEDKL